METSMYIFDRGGYNETKEIINTFNQVLERLRSIDQSRQEFVSNALMN